MAVSYVNIWGNLLDKLTNVFRTEFSFPVIKGEVDHASNNYIRLIPQGSTLTEYYSAGEQREYDILIQYITSTQNADERFIDYITRQTSRVEALVHENIDMTLADSTSAFNCRLDSQEYNVEIDGLEDKYIIQWSFNCSHIGNVA